VSWCVCYATIKMGKVFNRLAALAALYAIIQYLRRRSKFVHLEDRVVLITGGAKGRYAVNNIASGACTRTSAYQTRHYKQRYVVHMCLLAGAACFSPSPSHLVCVPCVTQPP